MALHRTFATAYAEAVGEQPTFEFRGETFECVPLGQVPAATAMDAVAARRGSASFAEQTYATTQFVLACLTEDAARRFDTLIRRPWTPDWPVVSDDELRPLYEWLIELFLGGVPTQPSNGLSSPPSPAGPSSRDGAGPGGSAPGSSPPSGMPAGVPAGEPPVRDYQAEAEAAAAEAAAAAAAADRSPPASAPPPAAARRRPAKDGTGGGQTALAVSSPGPPAPSSTSPSSGS